MFGFQFGKEGIDEKLSQQEARSVTVGRCGEVKQISVRSNFNPLALFSPKSMTNEQGKANVRFKLPDNLTKYRITADALKGQCKFGIHESSMVAQLRLAIRPSLPRFLNFGDRAEFSCVLQSQVPMNLEVNAVINFTNLKLLDSTKKGLKIKLPAMGRVELRFPMCTESAGIARFQIGVSIATSGINFADMNIHLSVVNKLQAKCFPWWPLKIFYLNLMFQNYESRKRSKELSIVVFLRLLQDNI